MEYIKLIHVSCAILTGLSFVVRGIWMIQDSPRLKSKVSKILPHVIDTLLLASAIMLLSKYNMNPLQHPWLIAKIIALLVYIALGMMAFRFARTRSYKITFWLLAMMTLFCIYGFAISKRVIFW